ncbi:MAG: cation:proton antiporter [Cytophagales bacterium]|nr:cation:proton antiporter [Cytophagales bacterium]
MLAAIPIDPVISKLVVLSIAITLISFVFKLLKQPYVIAYILVGVLMGPFGLKLVTDESLISNLGSFGMVLLLFFIGMEISLPQLVANWRIPVLGTLIQLVFSLMVVWVLGSFLGWQLDHVVVLGLVISLSSSAIVINYLQDKRNQPILFRAKYRRHFTGTGHISGAYVDIAQLPVGSSRN